MATSTGTVTIDTTATPHAVYARLSDVTALGTWLRRSPVYRGTSIPATAAAAATASDPTATSIPATATAAETATAEVDAASRAYVDHTPLGALAGRIVTAIAPERLEFMQATADGALGIRIVYDITPVGTGSRVVRTGTITTAGPLRWLHPLIVATTRWENRRTMAQLRAALDHADDRLDCTSASAPSIHRTPPPSPHSPAAPMTPAETPIP